MNQQHCVYPKSIQMNQLYLYIEKWITKQNSYIVHLSFVAPDAGVIFPQINSEGKVVVKRTRKLVILTRLSPSKSR